MPSLLPRVVPGFVSVRSPIYQQFVFGDSSLALPLECTVWYRASDSSGSRAVEQVALQVPNALGVHIPALLVGFVVPCSAGDVYLPRQLVGGEGETVNVPSLPECESCFVFRWSDCPFLAGYVFARGEFGDLVAVPMR